MPADRVKSVVILQPDGSEVSAHQYIDKDGEPAWLAPGLGRVSPVPGSRVVEFPPGSMFCVFPDYQECEAKDIGIKIH